MGSGVTGFRAEKSGSGGRGVGLVGLPGAFLGIRGGSMDAIPLFS